jgi:DNA polymerase-3 subunit epsilon
MKILWFDSETGGLKPKLNPILTLAGIIEVGGKVVEEFYFKIKPFHGQIVEDGALKVNGITREEIATFEEPRIVHDKLNAILGKYCNKFDRNDKFIPGGHNVGFDIEQLIAFYELAGDKYLFSWLDYHKFDTMTLSLLLKKKGWIDVPNVKLETMCQAFGIQIKAHNAQEDIRATKQLWEAIEGRLVYKP